jgi:hypothetical protein
MDRLEDALVVDVGGLKFIVQLADGAVLELAAEDADSKQAWLRTLTAASKKASSSTADHDEDESDDFFSSNPLALKKGMSVGAEGGGGSSSNVQQQKDPKQQEKQPPSIWGDIEEAVATAADEPLQPSADSARYERKASALLRAPMTHQQLQQQQRLCVLLLVTSTPATSEIESSQTKLRALLGSLGTNHGGGEAPTISELDGSVASNRGARNALFAISELRGQYPQVFVRDWDGGDQKIGAKSRRMKVDAADVLDYKFLGGFGEVQDLVDDGKFEKALVATAAGMALGGSSAGCASKHSPFKISPASIQRYCALDGRWQVQGRMLTIKGLVVTFDQGRGSARPTKQLVMGENGAIMLPSTKGGNWVAKEKCHERLIAKLHFEKEGENPIVWVRSEQSGHAKELAAAEKLITDLTSSSESSSKVAAGTDRIAKVAAASRQRKSSALGLAGRKNSSASGGGGSGGAFGESGGSGGGSGTKRRGSAANFMSMAGSSRGFQQSSSSPVDAFFDQSRNAGRKASTNVLGGIDQRKQSAVDQRKKSQLLTGVRAGERKQSSVGQRKQSWRDTAAASHRRKTRGGTVVGSDGGNGEGGGGAEQTGLGISKNQLEQLQKQHHDQVGQAVQLTGAGDAGGGSGGGSGSGGGGRVMGWKAKQQAKADAKTKGDGAVSQESTDLDLPRWKQKAQAKGYTNASARPARPFAIASGSSSDGGRGRSTKRGSGKGGFSLVGSGSGGFGEIEGALEEQMLCFGLMRFTIGTGTFSRVKYILLHFIGAECGAMHRGRGNARKSEAAKALGPCHADLVFNGKAELEEELVLGRLLQIFSSDGDLKGGGGLSIAQLKADYDRMLREAKELVERAAREKAEREAAKKKVAEEARLRKKKEEEDRARAKKIAEEKAKQAKKEAAEKAGKGGRDDGVHLAPLALDCSPPLSAEQCIAYVKDVTGPYNWLLVESAVGKGGGLTLVNAGALGSNQMSVYVKDDRVYFGLLRLAFGTGRYRRTKWAFVSWSGEKVSYVLVFVSYLSQSI